MLRDQNGRGRRGPLPIQAVQFVCDTGSVFPRGALMRFPNSSSLSTSILPSAQWPKNCAPRILPDDSRRALIPGRTAHHPDCRSTREDEAATPDDNRGDLPNGKRPFLQGKVTRLQKEPGTSVAAKGLLLLSPPGLEAGCVSIFRLKMKSYAPCVDDGCLEVSNK